MMDDKVKLYVFARKEIALIFVFMVLTALTSFYFGVKVGKAFILRQSGITPEDQSRVQLLSGQEETVQKMVQEMPAANQEGQSEKVSKDAYQLLKDKINQEFKEEENQMKGPGHGQSPSEANVTATVPAQPTDSKADAETTSTGQDHPAVESGNDKVGQFYHETTASGQQNVTSKYAGKYTIQLGSYNSRPEAEKFADGFRVRGYVPIIQEKEVEGRGMWFRINLGVFETLSEAKDYILKERSLFQGQDYVIGKFE
ncbi:MAG: SPOR domain-containing protein [Bdellovibrionota bacterium]